MGSKQMGRGCSKCKSQLTRWAASCEKVPKWPETVLYQKKDVSIRVLSA